MGVVAKHFNTSPFSLSLLHLAPFLLTSSLPSLLSSSSPLHLPLSSLLSLLPSALAFFHAHPSPLGTGSFVAAVSHVVGRQPDYILGKPEKPMFDAVKQM